MSLSPKSPTTAAFCTFSPPTVFSLLPSFCSSDFFSGFVPNCLIFIPSDVKRKHYDALPLKQQFPRQRPSSLFNDNLPPIPSCMVFKGRLPFSGFFSFFPNQFCPWSWFSRLNHPLLFFLFFTLKSGQEAGLAPFPFPLSLNNPLSPDGRVFFIYSTAHL